MRKVMLLLCLCAILLSCVGCGSDQEPNETTPAEEPMTAEELAQYCADRVLRVDVHRDENDYHGTGFFIDGEGTFVTNYTLIENAETVRVLLPDGTERSVTEFVDWSPYYNIAVLKIDVAENAYFEIATGSEQYNQGRQIYTYGYAADLDTTSVNGGLISADSVGLGLMDCITFDTASTQNVGGRPVVNTDGKVIAISYTQDYNYGIKLTALDELDMDKKCTLNDYAVWYGEEIDNSYRYKDTSGSTTSYGDTYINKYQTVTGVACVESLDTLDPDGVKDSYGYSGYKETYAYYAYSPGKENRETYCDYLESIGFEYIRNETVQNRNAQLYQDKYNQYKMWVFTDIEGYVIVSRPVKY